jgi:uncharacterized protein YjbI with pentapeptide repeats
VADPKQIAKLDAGVVLWNEWREENPSILPDLAGAQFRRESLSGANLTNADLTHASLGGANLCRARLERADLSKAWMSGANLNSANLTEAKLNGTYLTGASMYQTDLTRSDLTEAYLDKANLDRANLCGAALCNAYLYDASLAGTKLNGADFTDAKMSHSNLRGVNLSEGKLRNACLIGADLNGANLSGANLIGANMSSADVGGGEMNGADLRVANLTETNLVLCKMRHSRLNWAILTGSDLRSANLQEAELDNAILTDAKLWETQRAGWSIKGIKCARVYWDEDGLIPTEYAPGEFEKLYSNRTCIELFYQGGISTFELNTLPALLHRLASKHCDTQIRLQTIEATGGGTKVTISLGDANETTKGEVEKDAAQILQAQLALRNDDVRRLQFERDFFQTRLDSITNALIAAAAPQIHFHAPVQTAALPSGSARVEIHQTFDDNSALITLFDRFITYNSQFTGEQAVEIEAAKAELQKPNPDKPRLTRFYDFLKSLPKEAVLKGAGKLGERAAEADWSNLLHQFGELIHHLH